MNQQLPIFSDVARWFAYPVLSANNKPGVTIAAAGGTGFGSIVLMPQNYFVLTNFRAVTNYDNSVNAQDVFDPNGIAAPATITPFIPNNFTLQIQRGQSNNYSSLAMTQAEIASSGYYAGKQLPLPIVYGPRFNFQFNFTDTTGLFLSTGDGDTALALQIQMFMEGYCVPITQWDLFLNYFPNLANVMDPPVGVTT